MIFYKNLLSNGAKIIFLRRLDLIPFLLDYVLTKPMYNLSKSYEKALVKKHEGNTLALLSNCY